MRACNPPLDERERHLRARIAGLEYAVSVTARSIERARDKHARVIATLRDTREEFAALRSQRINAEGNHVAPR